VNRTGTWNWKPAVMIAPAPGADENTIWPVPLIVKAPVAMPLIAATTVPAMGSVIVRTYGFGPVTS